MFSVQVGSTVGACVLTLRGELDHDSAVQMDEAADQVFAEGRHRLLVVDCTELEFCDSSGIGCLVRMYQHLAARGGVLRLAAVPASVARVLSLTGLDQAIAVHATLHDAFRAGGARPTFGSDDGLSALPRASGR
ncbi:STAS domain-containing protein [Streptomyces longwoodensis]|uniref:STAS domain-containing protein n=1 Tax=Streptomyces TaxID=1883 RepID=UPI00143D0222|nr:STAS domain-containing protein [Streptomyces lasalocidi]